MATRSEIFNRRDFLKLSGLLFAAALFPATTVEPSPNISAPSPQVPVSTQHPEAMPSGLDVTLSGVNKIGVDGVEYVLTPNTTAIQTVFTEVAGSYPDPSVSQRVADWLPAARLDIKVFRSWERPLAAGYFWPSTLNFSTHRTQIGLNQDVVKDVFAPRAYGDLSPLTTLPHEVRHVIDFLHNPALYYAILPIAFMQTALAYTLATAASKQDTYKPRLAKHLRAVQYIALMEAAKSVVGLSTHNKNYSDESITQSIDQNPTLRHASRTAITFTPVSDWA